MAQAKIEPLEQPDGCAGEKELNDKQGCSSSLECAVCLQTCDIPVKLPCSHIFCFLCIKGVANQSNKCPMCRQDIPADFVDKPQLVEVEESNSLGNEGEHQWFYEGRNGWWQYDQRTSIELETAYKQGKRTCELLIAGNLYIADFGSMEQFRRNEPRRHRRIKRDLSNVPKKGVAGLRLNTQDSDEPIIVREIRGAERAASPASDSMGTEDGTSTPVPPSNTPQTPGGQISGDATPLSDRTDQRPDSLHQVLEQMSSLTLMRGGRFSLNNDNDDEETNNETSFSDNHSSVRWLNSSDSNPTFVPDEDNS